MNATALLAAIRNTVRETSKQGAGTVSVVDLDRYLASLEVPAQAQDALVTPEVVQAQIALFKSATDERLEMFRSVVASGADARHSVLWINGGAAVALLGFLGTRGTALTADAKTLFAAGLSYFVLGVLLSAIASGGTYLAQAFYHRGKQPLGNLFNVLAISAVASAYVAFGAGGYQAYRGLAGETATALAPAPAK